MSSRFTCTSVPKYTCIFFLYDGSNINMFVPNKSTTFLYSLRSQFFLLLSKNMIINIHFICSE